MPEGRRVRRLAALAALTIFLLTVPCLAVKEDKPSRLLSGTVSDEAENPIVGAVVVLTDLQAGKKTATYTGAGGTYQFSGLQFTRDYEVQASHKGLVSEVRKVSTIDPRNRIVIHLRIPPPKE